ncbi:MAG: nucleotidyltransferase [Eubacterium sp.]|nr:nucleotidyltransferase [Eubacterium sp.]
MKTIGIIAEFNPFHNGHKYLIHQAKKITGADKVIVVCSGNFVQRGIPAIYDKYARADIALSYGADVILELPIFYATASAELFARGGVSLLEQLQCVDYLCFGCEASDSNHLSTLGDILSNEPPRYKILLKEALSKGYSYPKARSLALQNYCLEEKLLSPASVNEIMQGSNNILALEYYKALNHFQSSIKPIAIKRQGSDYNDTSTDQIFASSTGIRKEIFSGNLEAVRKHMPDYALKRLQYLPAISNDDMDLLLGQKLLTNEDFSIFHGISQELSNRILKNRNHYTSFTSFAQLLQTKNYTYTAISRALLHLCLGIKTEDVESLMEQNYHTYVRVLGFKKTSSVLSTIKQNSNLTIIGKFADYYGNTTGIIRSTLNQAIQCDHLYRMIQMNKTENYIPTEFERKILIK